MKFIKKHRRVLVAIAFISTVVFGSLFTLNRIAHARAVEYKAPVEPSQCDTLSDIKKYACEAVERTWSAEEWVYFDKIVKKESNWTVFGPHYATGHTSNGVKSSAYGLCGTMISMHEIPDDFKENPYSQADWCIKYVLGRYGSPTKAWQFHIANNWF